MRCFMHFFVTKLESYTDTDIVKTEKFHTLFPCTATQMINLRALGIIRDRLNLEFWFKELQIRTQFSM